MTISAEHTRIAALGAAERRVLLELVRRGPQSRVRLAERVGMSRASLTRISRVLLDAGLVLEGEPESPGARGRPAEVLRPRPGAAVFLGVKYTAEHVYLVLTDLCGSLIAETSTPLPSRDFDEALEIGIAAGDGLLGDLDNPSAVGIAVAGDVVVEGGESILRRSGFLGWDGVPLARRVAEHTSAPVTVFNDVNALAGAQHWFGGPRHSPLVVLGVGAGIGSGIVLDDELHVGAHGLAGRVGHSRIGAVLGAQGRPCANGHLDCVHSFATVPAIEEGAGVAPGEYAEAVRRAVLGEPGARAAFERAAFAVGIAVADAVNAVDPDAVAVTGEGVHCLDLAPEVFRQGLADGLEGRTADSVRIERPLFHFDLYARAAAVMAMRELLAEH
ncbi:ROK family transcriptional regulator [Agromyces seonyuensis]|nr:ROK family transcriptional regulator [Agromyces seonyuensis]